MYLIKREFNNGVFDCLEIYHTTNKIKEITNGILWNAAEENPICVAKSRASDYTVSDELLDVEENIDIIKKEEKEEIIVEK